MTTVKTMEQEATRLSFSGTFDQVESIFYRFPRSKMVPTKRTCAEALVRIFSSVAQYNILLPGRPDEIVAGLNEIGIPAKSCEVASSKDPIPKIIVYAGETHPMYIALTIV